MSHEQHHLLGDNVNHPNVNISGELKGDVLWHNGSAWSRLEKGTSGHFLKISGENVLWASTGGAGNQSLFETVSADSGTNPVADSTTDTLNIAGGIGIKTAGDSANDRISISFSISGEVAGDIPYKTATTWTRRSAGSQNQFLQQGAGNIPTWANVISGEKVKISDTDPIADHLINKIAAGSNVTITKSNSVSGELLTIASIGGGGTITVQENDVTVGGGSFSTFDFNGNDFAVTESPASEANIAIDYTNGQTANPSTKGFLTAADYTNFSDFYGNHVKLSGEHVTNGNSHDHLGGDGAQIDHGGLAGLTDDDHAQYPLIAGRSGGQIIYGGTISGEDLRLSSTSNATKGRIIIDENSRTDIGDAGLEPNGVNVNGTTYDTLLRVNNFGAGMQAQFMVHRHSSTLAPVIMGSRSISDTTSHTSVLATTELLRLLGVGWTGSHYDQFASISFQAGSGEISTTSSPGRLIFNVTANGAQTPTEALRISQDKTTQLSGKLDIDGNVILNSGELTLPTLTDTIIGRNTVDTLTNKTLTTPTIGSFVNAGHNHTNAANGGQIVSGETGISKVTGNDTTLGYLSGKLTAGSGITLTVNNAGANESLDIATTGGGAATITVQENDITIGSGSFNTVDFNGNDFAVTELPSGEANVTIDYTNAQSASSSAKGFLTAANYTTFADFSGNHTNLSGEHVTNGNTHDHSGGDGAQINHTTLSNIGSNSHTVIDTHIAAISAHGVSGEVVGTASVQTLSSKTLLIPTIVDLTNMNHAHSGASSGGQMSHANLTNIGSNAHAVLDAHLTYTTTHGVSGEIVGTISTQTLTNKNLTTPTIADLTNMNHGHSSVATGGQFSHANLTNIGSNTHTVLDAHLTYTTTHGVSGEIVGTASTQTLTNKTLTTPTIGSFTNATHNHQNAAGGGQIISGENGRVRVSGNDATLGYLNGKLVAGTNITLTENSDGGDETLTIAATGGAGTQNLFETISADSGTNAVADSTTDTLNIAGGTGIRTAGDSANDRITVSLSISGEVAGDFLYRTATAWTRLASGETNQFIQQGASSIPTWKTIQQTANIGIIVDGGGSAITTGKKGNIEIPWNCTINSATLLADQTGSIVVDVWRDNYANYPPSGEDSICAAAKPTISASNKAQDTTLTGWSTSLLKGQILGFNVDSVATITRVSVNLGVTKT